MSVLPFLAHCLWQVFFFSLKKDPNKSCSLSSSERVKGEWTALLRPLLLPIASSSQLLNTRLMNGSEWEEEDEGGCIAWLCFAPPIEQRLWCLLVFFFRFLFVTADTLVTTVVKTIGA